MLPGTVYLLHFERPISPLHTCQHYLGWCLDLDARIAAHRSGAGARLTQVAVERGIGFEVVRTWPGSRTFERLLKARKDTPRLCPVCCQAHGRRVRPAIAVQQLALDLDEPAPWEAPDYQPPALQPDWYEIAWLRRARAASAAAAPRILLDDGLIELV